ncbi:TPA: hypothetical protein PJF95_003289 [Escherichia coli]|nr:hypothetical protein [Escherichia coli]HDH7176654.1 hypothetical protein [Escherichia coli]
MARFVVLVIDSFGVGAMKDVTLVRPQDAGANTCGHILSQLPHLQLPTLEKLGLINGFRVNSRSESTAYYPTGGAGAG